VVETGGLENRFTGNRNGGSNPSPSANVCLLGAVVILAAWVAGTSAEQTPKPATPLESMVAAERAFAAATAEIGVRNGFLTFFANDSVAIETVTDGNARIVDARSRIAAGPEPPQPLPNLLSWKPFIGQVSADGTFGWLTGPYENLNKNTGAVGYGIYFSVWRRQADGVWKVWLDQGITTPERWSLPTDFRAADASGRPSNDAFDNLDASIASDAALWSARLAPSVRLHRQGQGPVLGREAAARWRADTWRTARYSSVRAERSPAGDIVVVAGGYTATTASGTEERGIFIRVWQVASDGRWRIVLETSKPN
jgi:hypothetical protein